MRLWSRRGLVLAGLGATWPLRPQAAEAWLDRRVVALNWAIAETLYAMGIRPVGAAEVPSYDALVREPRTPEGVTDVGLQGEPNLELLHELAPDLILIQSWQAGLTEALRRCGPVESLTLFSGGGDPVARASDAARRIGFLLGCPNRAGTLIERADSTFATCRAELARAPHRPIYLVQTIDRGSLSVFTRGGLFQAVLDRLGLRNAWTGAPNLMWGGTRIGVDKLAGDADATLVLIAPPVPGGEDALAGSALWSHLPAVRARRVIHLPLLWGFGAVPTATRFANLLTQALIATPDA